MTFKYIYISGGVFMEDYFIFEKTETEEYTFEKITSNNSVGRTHYHHKINADQPGSGKTKELIEKLEATEEGQDLIIGSSHELLDELKTRCARKIVIMRGFTKSCSNWNQNVDGELTDVAKKIRLMHEKEVPNHVICACMECQNRCHYREQFTDYKEPDIIIAMPVQLVHLFDEFSQFNSVNIEERVQGKFDLKWDSDKIKMEFYKLKNNLSIKYYNKILEAIKTKDYFELSSFEEEIQEATEKYNSHSDPLLIFP